jgi:hypothetical protein
VVHHLDAFKKSDGAVAISPHRTRLENAHDAGRCPVSTDIVGRIRAIPLLPSQQLDYGMRIFCAGRFRLELVYLLGPAASTYTIRLHVEGQPVQEFANLSLVSPEFRQAHWIGFVSNSVEAAVMYMDDVKLIVSE